MFLLYFNNLHNYPAPPELAGDVSEERKMEALLESYQDFAMELHAGMLSAELSVNDGAIHSDRCARAFAIS